MLSNFQKVVSGPTHVPTHVPTHSFQVLNLLDLIGSKRERGKERDHLVSPLTTLKKSEG